jgi:hypothetical protein
MGSILFGQLSTQGRIVFDDDEYASQTIRRRDRRREGEEASRRRGQAAVLDRHRDRPHQADIRERGPEKDNWDENEWDRRWIKMLRARDPEAMPKGDIDKAIREQESQWDFRESMAQLEALEAAYDGGDWWDDDEQDEEKEADDGWVQVKSRK